MVTFLETERQLVASDIREIEKTLGFSLPRPYAEHLLQHNGGRCVPDIFKFAYPDGRESASLVDWFLAVYDGKYNNLRDYLRDLKFEEKRVPRQIVPIAHDPGGNLICISCFGPDEGVIYFWDHENEVDYYVADDSDYSNLHKIADSLAEFFNGLTAFEE